MKSQRAVWIGILISALIAWYLTTLYHSDISIKEDDGVEVEAIDPALLSKPLPDFAVITDVNEKKQRFFDYLEPFIDHENTLLAAKRERLKTLNAQSNYSAQDRQWLLDMVQRYRIHAQLSEDSVIEDKVFAELLLKIDQIPPSLVMAQAANESGWGTSRFAREANNLFGQWCFKIGCGLVPASRPEGETYEVRRFDSMSGSVSGYFHNINSQPSYHSLRALRRNFRLVGRGHEAGEWLAEGLLAYSSRGEEYVREIQAMIRVNKLSQYDIGVLGNDPG